MSDALYSIVRTFPALEATPCQSCPRVIQPGEPITFVYHRWRFMRSPTDEGNRRYVCTPCADRMGARPSRYTLHATAAV